MFCRSLFIILSFFFWSLCCLPFFDLRILITGTWPMDLNFPVFATGVRIFRASNDVGPLFLGPGSTWILEINKVLIVFEFITFFGILFHSSTTLCEKLYFLTFVLQFFLYNFLLWPLVVVWLDGRICSYCTYLNTLCYLMWFLPASPSVPL